MQHRNGEHTPSDDPGHGHDEPLELSNADLDLDEVLVFQMDDEEDGPQLPEGLGEEVATYGAPPAELEVEPDEFSELGEAWEARLSGDEAELEPATAAPARRRLVAVAAGAGALVAVLAVGLSRGPSEDEGGADVDVARRAPAAGAPVESTGAAAEADRSERAAPPPVESATDEPVEPAEPRSMVGGLASLFGAGARSAGEPFGPEGTGPEGTLVAADGAAASDRERREGVLPIEDQVVLPDPLPDLQMADPSAFASVWASADLPQAGAAHERFVQTPLFGDARVHTDAEEFFDGTLLGLGGGRLVLRTRAGELTLRAQQVVAIERLEDADASVGTLVARTFGERVRVRAAGGWLRGEVVRQDAETVTLLLDSGGRITVDRADVRPAGGSARPRLYEPPSAG